MYLCAKFQWRLTKDTSFKSCLARHTTFKYRLAKRILHLSAVNFFFVYIPGLMGGQNFLRGLLLPTRGSLSLVATRCCSVETLFVSLSFAQSFLTVRCQLVVGFSVTLFVLPTNGFIDIYWDPTRS